MNDMYMYLHLLPCAYLMLWRVEQMIDLYFFKLMTKQMLFVVYLLFYFFPRNCYVWLNPWYHNSSSSTNTSRSTEYIWPGLHDQKELYYLIWGIRMQKYLDIMCDTCMFGWFDKLLVKDAVKVPSSYNCLITYNIKFQCPLNVIFYQLYFI